MRHDRDDILATDVPRDIYLWKWSVMCLYIYTCRQYKEKNERKFVLYETSICESPLNTRGRLWPQDGNRRDIRWTSIMRYTLKPFSTLLFLSVYICTFTYMYLCINKCGCVTEYIVTLTRIINIPSFCRGKEKKKKKNNSHLSHETAHKTATVRIIVKFVQKSERHAVHISPTQREKRTVIFIYFLFLFFLQFILNWFSMNDLFYIVIYYIVKHTFLFFFLFLFVSIHCWENIKFLKYY